MNPHRHFKGNMQTSLAINLTMENVPQHYQHAALNTWKHIKEHIQNDEVAVIEKVRELTPWMSPIVVGPKKSLEKEGTSRNGRGSQKYIYNFFFYSNQHK